MIFTRRIFLILISFFAGNLALIAQNRDFIREEGEVVEGEFVINKELDITLPTAQRIFIKVPPEELERRETEPLQYSFADYKPTLIDIPTQLRVLKLKDAVVTQSPASYLKLGFGNYFTPLFQLGLNSGASKQSNYGLKIDHLSSKNGPVDKDKSGDSRTTFGVFGKHIGGKASLEGDVEFNRLGYHFYGYEDTVAVNKEDIGQNFNDINLGFRIQNSKPETTVNYQVFGRVSHVSDKYDASEFGFDGGLKTDINISESVMAGLNLDYVFLAYQNPGSINRSLVRIYPKVAFLSNGFNIDAGFKVLNHNDTLNNENNTRVYPSVKVSYDLTDDFTAYGVLDGDVETLSYRNVIYENPFVNADLPLNHTIKNLELTAGVKGKLARMLAYDAGVSSIFYKNMYFYINDPEAFSKFTIIYDEGTTSLFQIFGSLSYTKARVMGASMSVRVNGYNPGELSKAWHKPALEFDYSMWFNIYDKLKISGDIFALSGIRALESRTEPQQTISLKGAFDLNLKLDYALSDRYGAFVSVNNLLNNNYERFYKYPSRGLLAIAGISVNF